MKKIKKISLFLFVFLSGTNLFSQNLKTFEVGEDSTNQNAGHEEILSVIENTLQNYYRDFYASENESETQIEMYGEEEESIPDFSDSVYISRLKVMNQTTPFNLDYNADVLKNIRLFAQKRREFIRVVLGRSTLYFNMFEEKLLKHDLPVELKYLSVIESGLQPKAKSRAGALGLWQFMYRTGKIFGLKENSYIDERMDPELATEAACQYLKQLYGLYNDWNVALAAYNAGPGNVNKAIRRSGGKMTYWEIRPFLPRETQNYVPNYIAVSYLMTYHAEHNILPKEPKIHDFEVDTVCLRKPLHMATIDSLVGWNALEIKELNPKFKMTFIPKTTQEQCLQIPIPFVEKWIEMEDSLYALEDSIYNFRPKIENEKLAPQKTPENTAVHYVKSGQTLGHIAGIYGTTVKSIMRLNNMHNTRLSIGQKLIVNGKQAVVASAAQNQKHPKKSTNSKTEHIVNRGDNFWDIARKNGTTVEELKRLNPNINHMDLKVGQKIRIR